jgi:hypothetical protein
LWQFGGIFGRALKKEKDNGGGVKGMICWRGDMLVEIDVRGG